MCLLDDNVRSILLTLLVLCSVIVLIISFFSFSKFTPAEPLTEVFVVSVGVNLKDNPMLVLEVISWVISLSNEWASLKTSLEVVSSTNVWR